MMDKSKDKIVESLKAAIQGEADGYQFYTIASETTKDEVGKETFRDLAGEELVHLDFLKAQMKSISETGAVDPSVNIGKVHKFKAHGPLFSEELVSRINEAQFEMSALSIGVKLELNSIQFYREKSEEADDRNVKKFFNDLADWETDHYHALLKQQEMLHEQFWATGGFAPF